MKILQVHKHCYRRDGASTYFLDLSQLLARKGHTVGLWGTNENFKSNHLSSFYLDEKLLVDEIHFDRRENIFRDIANAGHMIWSREAQRKFERMLDRFAPDIIHVHNIYHHLSSSILRVASQRHIPVVMSLHDWKLINPNYALFDHGKICERTGLAAIAHRCIQNSVVSSAIAVTESSIRHWIHAEQGIVAYHVPTDFVQRKLVAGGISSQKISVIPYFISPLQVTSYKLQDYILFAGRLSEEKGVDVLLKAAALAPKISIKIAGTGPLSCALKAEVICKGLKNVEFLGFQEKSALQKLIREARAVVVPSVWFDPSPFAVLEAQALGKAVVASRIGGIPDLIQDGKTGFLVPARFERPLVDVINRIYYDTALLERVGKAAANMVRQRNNPDDHYKEMMKIYRRVGR